MRTNGTTSIATTFLVFLACLSTACTTMRPIAADASGDKVREALKPGDTVHVLTKGGASHALEVTEVGATSLIGKTVRMVGVGTAEGWGSPIEIPYADIGQIEVRRVKGVATMAIVAVLVLGADVAINSSRGGQRCCISR